MRLFPKAILLAPLVLVACQKHGSTPVAAPAAPIVEGNRVTLPPQTLALATALAEPAGRQAGAATHLTGRLVWNEDATVRVYSPVAGRVRAVLGNIGDQVAVDAPLARIDSPDFGQAQADVRKADADSLLAARTLERTRLLFEHGAAPRKDVEAAEDALAGAQAEQERAASRLALFGAKQATTVDQAFVLRAPLAGTIVERNINVGQELRPDLMLANAPQLIAPQFVISDPRQLWVMLDVTEMDIRLLQAGQRLKISTRALPGQTFVGVLQSIGSALDPTTRTIKARGGVDNSSSLLKAEMYVDVEVEVAANDASATEIASPAVISKDDRNYVFVETAPHVFERREVQVADETSGQAVILSGIRSGDRVLVQGSLLVEQLLEAGGHS